MKHSLNLILFLILIVLGLQLWQFLKQSKMIKNESYVSASAIGGTVWKFTDNTLNVTLTVNADKTASVKKVMTIPSIGTTEQRFFMTWESLNETDLVFTVIQPSSKNASTISWCTKTPKLYGTLQGTTLSIFTDQAKTQTDVVLSQQQAIKNIPIFRGASERVGENPSKQIELCINPDGCGRLKIMSYGPDGALKSNMNIVVLVSVTSPTTGTISSMIDDCVDATNEWSYVLKEQAQIMTLTHVPDQVVYNLTSRERICSKCIDTNCSGMPKDSKNFTICSNRVKQSTDLCKRECDLSN